MLENPVVVFAMRFAILILLQSVWWCNNLSAQEIQNGLSYREVPHGDYFRVNYENDLAFHTDYYYTQGVHFEVLKQSFRNDFLRALFPLGKGGFRRFGYGLESAGYTPMSIIADSILRGDRPFAGMAYAKVFAIANHPAHASRIVSALSLGWMGPAAGGYEIQAYIHRHTGNLDPVGWKYQVGNSPVINCEVDYERALTGSLQHFLVTAWGMAIMAGEFDEPFLRTS